MSWTTLHHRRGLIAAPLLLLLAAGGSTGCGDMLKVTDPLSVEESDLNDAEGAELLARSPITLLNARVGDAIWESGLVADEFLFQQSASADLFGVVTGGERLDRRGTMDYFQLEGGNTSGYTFWQSLWLGAANAAVEKLRAHGRPGAREARIGEMFALRGFAALHLAEDFCPGFPLHKVVDYKLIYSSPLSTEQAFEHALAAFDSAVSWAADSARVLNFARVGRARTLLNLGRFAEAAGSATAVPTNYKYQTEYSTTTNVTNVLASEPGWQQWGTERSVADREGANGLDFVSAKDPRVPTDSLGLARDSVTRLYGVDKYPSRTTPIVLASGVEARLIEAEAALKASDYGTWLTKLNQLRQTVGLADTTDPGTDDARIDLTFRERAFWLFGTGHRLGDLRRLTRQYGRASESVFPAGPYWRGGVYSTGTSLPFSKGEVLYSPGVTGCTSW